MLRSVSRLICVVSHRPLLLARLARSLGLRSHWCRRQDRCLLDRVQTRACSRYPTMRRGFVLPWFTAPMALVSVTSQGLGGTGPHCYGDGMLPAAEGPTCREKTFAKAPAPIWSIMNNPARSPTNASPALNPDHKVGARRRRYRQCLDDGTVTASKKNIPVRSLLRASDSPLRPALTIYVQATSVGHMVSHAIGLISNFFSRKDIVTVGRGQAMNSWHLFSLMHSVF